MKRVRLFTLVVLVIFIPSSFMSCKRTEKEPTGGTRDPAQTSSQSANSLEQPEGSQPPTSPHGAGSGRQGNGGGDSKGGSDSSKAEGANGKQGEEGAAAGGDGTKDSVRARIEAVQKRLAGEETCEGSRRLSEVKSRAANALDEAEKLMDSQDAGKAQADTAQGKLDEVEEALAEYERLLPEYKKVKELLRQVEEVTQAAKAQGKAIGDLEARLDEIERNLEKDYARTEWELQEVLKEYEKLSKEQPSRAETEQKDSASDKAAEAKATAEDARRRAERHKDTSQEKWQQGEAKMKEASEAGDPAEKARRYKEAESSFEQVTAAGIRAEIGKLLQQAKQALVRGDSQEVQEIMAKISRLEREYERVRDAIVGDIRERQLEKVKGEKAKAVLREAGKRAETALARAKSFGQSNAELLKKGEEAMRKGEKLNSDPGAAMQHYTEAEQLLEKSISAGARENIDGLCADAGERRKGGDEEAASSLESKAVVLEEKYHKLQEQLLEDIGESSGTGVDVLEGKAMEAVRAAALAARARAEKYGEAWPADWEKGEAKLEEALDAEADARKAGQLYEEAEASFERVVQQQVGWLIERAKAERAAGNNEKATALLQEALSLDPDNKEVRSFLGTLPRIPEGCEWIPEKGTRKDGKRSTYDWDGVIFPTAIRHKESGIELVLIPPGEYVMGSPEEVKERDADEVPHKVIITRPFYLGRTEVTQKQYKRIVGKNPSRFSGDNLPVEKASWHDATAFCKWLGAGFRLPTEAEWEYACRAGSRSRWCCGDKEGDLGKYAWFKKNSEERTHDVATKQPNEFGLYDMHGNIWEWCSDWYGDYKKGESKDPKGPGQGVKHILRGGSWVNGTNPTRSAYRYRNEPFTVVDFNGFRVARAVD